MKELRKSVDYNSRKQGTGTIQADKKPSPGTPKKASIGLGATLFHPSTIQGSSTPKQSSVTSSHQHNAGQFDVNKALHDAYETPIR